MASSRPFAQPSSLTNSSSTSSVTHPLTILSPTPTDPTPLPTSTPSSTPPSSTPPPPPPSSTPPPPPPPSQTPTDTDTGTNTNTDGGNASTLPPTQSAAISTPATSVMESTSVGTMSDGQAFTTVIQSTTIIQQPAAITSPPDPAAANRGSSNTGAIVGGVVGGVGGLALVALIVWLLLRKRRQDREEDFDGNFDPARVVSGHKNGINLDDGAAGAAVTPYPYQPEMAQHRPSPSMDQYNDHPQLAGAAVGGYFPYHPTQSSPPPGAQPPGGPAGSWHGNGQPGYSSPTSDGGYTSSSHYPSPLTNSISTAATGAGVGGAMGAYFGNGPSPGPSEIGSGSASGSGHQGGYGVYPGSGRSAKEREAQGGRLAVSNVADEGNQVAGSSGAAFPHPHPFQQSHYGAGGPAATSPPPPSVGGVPTGAGEKSGLDSTAAMAGGPVRVHQDAGRVPVAEPDPEEIPPTYDSIPANERM